MDLYYKGLLGKLFGLLTGGAQSSITTSLVNLIPSENNENGQAVNGLSEAEYKVYSHMFKITIYFVESFKFSCKKCSSSKTLSVLC